MHTNKHACVQKTKIYKTKQKQNQNHTHTCFPIHSDTLLHVLQFLDVINMKDPTQKAHFYKTTLREALPFIPRVMKYNRTLSIHIYINLLQYNRKVHPQQNVAVHGDGDGDGDSAGNNSGAADS